MPLVNFIVFLLVGALAGWLSGVISKGSGFGVASVPLAACIPTDGTGVCTHLLVSKSTNTGAGFGMSLRGMDVGSSFAFSTPLVGCDPCLN